MTILAEVVVQVLTIIGWALFAVFACSLVIILIGGVLHLWLRDRR